MASSQSSMNNNNNNNNDAVFSDRVKKTFGSLFASLQPSPSPSSLSNPLWSLSGSEAEKREWRRDKDTSARDSTPCSSSFDDFLSHARKNSRKNLNNYRKELEEDDLDDVGGYEDDEGSGDLNDWDVRSSIGLDSTLDNEEEEDTFDKVATGRENAGDRLYMSDVTDNHDSHFGSEDDLSSVNGKRKRDPRANHWAARIRLKEDDAEAVAQTEQHKPEHVPSSKVEKQSAKSSEDGDKLKPILKRKENESIPKPSKRVRFDPGCISDGDREVSGDMTAEETETLDNVFKPNDRTSRVPDYVRNPSKYTCYSLDTTDELSDKSNTGAALDILELIKRSKNVNAGSRSQQEDVSIDLPKSVTFVPKKKSNTDKASCVDGESTQERECSEKRPSTQSSLLGDFAAGDDQETEVGDMEVDEPESSEGLDSGTTFKKQGRHYRSKSSTDASE